MFICKQPSWNRSSYAAMAYGTFLLTTQCERQGMTYVFYVYSSEKLPLVLSHSVLSPAITVTPHAWPSVCTMIVMFPWTHILPRPEHSYSICTRFTPNTSMLQYCKTLSTVHSPIALRFPTSAYVLRHILRTIRYRLPRSRIPHACLRTTFIRPSNTFLITTFLLHLHYQRSSSAVFKVFRQYPNSTPHDHFLTFLSLSWSFNHQYVPPHRSFIVKLVLFLSVRAIITYSLTPKHPFRS